MKARPLRAAQAAVLALACVASACSSGAQAGGALRAAELTGAVVSRGSASGAWTALNAGRVLAAGSEVRTPDGGWVRLVSGETSFELGPGSWASVRGAEGLVLKAGRVLASSTEAVAVADESGVSVRGSRSTWRFDLGVRVGVYRGKASVTLPAAPAEVSADHELTLGTSVADIEAFSLDPADRWDARNYPDAIELDRQLKPYTRSFDANYAASPNTAAFYGRFVDPKALGFLPSMLKAQLTGYGKLDVLVGLFLGLDTASAFRTTLARAVDAIVSFRNEGATWGLVAHAFGVKPSVLLDRLVIALTPGGTPQTVPASGSKGGGSSGAPTPLPGSSKPKPTPSSSFTPKPTPTPTDSPSPSPSPSPSSSPSPSPSPSQSCSPVDILLGRCSALG